MRGTKTGSGMVGWTCWLAAALLWLAPSVAHAQGAAPRVSAALSSGVAKLGETVRLIVTAENVDDGDLVTELKVEGLAIQPFSAPSSNISESIFNGRVSRSASLTWSTAIRPAKVGEFTIPAIAIRIGGKLAETAPLSLTVVADLKGEELGFIQIVPSSRKVVDGQPFTLEIRFGWDARKSSFNYAILALPWWDQLAGTLANDAPPIVRKASGMFAFVNNQRFEDVEELAPTTQRGISFRTFRILRTFTPTRSGSLEIPMSSLEFGRVVSRDDFFAFRQSLERAETFYARAEPLTIEIVPLPEEGKPLDFGGAIGKLAVKCSAEPRDVDVGDSIKFKVEWSGAANFEFFEPPDLERQDAFKNFRVYGKSETKSVDRRTVLYDIAPIKTDAREIPPLETPYFDPETMKYERVKTAPIAIHVRPLKDAKTLESESAAERASRDLVDIDAHAEPRRELSRLPGGLLLGGWVAVPALALALRSAVRRRGDPSTPAAKRKRRARKTLERELERAADARATQSAFCEFLAARTDETRDAWIGRRLDREFESRFDEELARELAQTLDELDRSAWSGESRAPDRARVLSLADRLIQGGL